MALIPCKNCGNNISDKAKVCPHCGASKEEPVNETETKAAICEECGAALPEGADACPKCGCPIPESSESAIEPAINDELSEAQPKETRKNKKLFITIGIITVVIIAIVAVLLGVQNAKKKAEAEAKAKAEAEAAAEAERISKEYYGNLISAVSTMLTGTIRAEDAAGLVHDVWYNCIYKKKDSATDKYTLDANGEFLGDFNVAISRLYIDSNFTKKIKELMDNQDSVNELMKSLNAPPEEYQNAYNDLKKLYDAYLTLSECVISPSGSLNSFTATFNQADEDVGKYITVMRTYYK